MVECVEVVLYFQAVLKARNVENYNSQFKRKLKEIVKYKQIFKNKKKESESSKS